MPWDIANFCIIGGRSQAVAQSKHEIDPHPWRYHMSRFCISGCVLLLPSHLSMSLANCSNVKVHPSSGHCATCWQVSSHIWQLRQSLHLPSWWDKNVIMPAMLLMCFVAHIWNNCSRSCTVPWTKGQSISSNCSWDKFLGCCCMITPAGNVTKTVAAPQCLMSSSPLWQKLKWVPTETCGPGQGCPNHLELFAILLYVADAIELCLLT